MSLPSAATPVAFILTADGTILTSLTKVMKNNAGYDLNQLAIDVTSVSLFNGGITLGKTGSLFDSDSSPWDFTFNGLTAGTYTLAVASSITQEWGIVPGLVLALGLLGDPASLPLLYRLLASEQTAGAAARASWARDASWCMRTSTWHAAPIPLRC